MFGFSSLSLFLLLLCKSLPFPPLYSLHCALPRRRCHHHLTIAIPPLLLTMKLLLPLSFLVLMPLLSYWLTIASAAPLGLPGQLVALDQYSTVN
jgi:hypothetical protein